MKLQKIYKTIKILSLIGVILAVYLLFEQITKSTFRPCNINSTINCDAIISGTVAKTFGIPTPLYGLLGYIGIFFAAFFGKKKFLLSLSSFGLVFCLSIAFIELFQLRVICPICILCQIIMISVFVLSIMAIRQEGGKTQSDSQ